MRNKVFTFACDYSFVYFVLLCLFDKWLWIAISLGTVLGFIFEDIPMIHCGLVPAPCCVVIELFDTLVLSTFDAGPVGCHHDVSRHQTRIRL